MVFNIQAAAKNSSCNHTTCACVNNTQRCSYCSWNCHSGVMFALYCVNTNKDAGCSCRVASFTDFSVEVRNLENDPYFSRFLYGVMKFSDFLQILQFFPTLFTYNWESSKLWSASVEVWVCSCNGVVYNFVSVNLNFVIKISKKLQKKNPYI